MYSSMTGSAQTYPSTPAASLLIILHFCLSTLRGRTFLSASIFAMSAMSIIPCSMLTLSTLNTPTANPYINHAIH